MTRLLCFLLLCIASTTAGAVPNEVDCAFRKLAVRTASRNLHGDAAKLAIVAAGLNVSDCPGGQYWAALFQAKNATKQPSTIARTGIHLFVSPSGDDANLGADVTSPLQTLAAAQKLVRGLLREKPEQAVTVNLKSGMYFENIVLGPEDSGCQKLSKGSSSSPECRVTWQNYQGDKPVISGGKKLNCTWEKTTINGNMSAYVCKVDTTITANFTSLFVEGKRLQRARYPNGDPSIPCNSQATCEAAGYTRAVPGHNGVGACRPNAQAVTNGRQVEIYNGDTLLSSGIVQGDPSGPPLKLNVTDSPFVHDVGAFEDFRAYEGGGVACYNASMNKPFWNAGTCNCKSFGIGADMAARATEWKTPSTGVVRMFHTARWGGWAFDVDQFTPDGPPPTPPPPPPPPGWGPLIHCTSCTPHDQPIKMMGKGGTLQQCQAACTADKNCTAINFAVDSDHNCYLFAKCSKPWNDPSECKNNINDWWSTQFYTRPGHQLQGEGIEPSHAPFSQQRWHQGPTSIISNEYFAENILDQLQEEGGGPSHTPTLSITGGQQTGQQGPTSITSNDYFVENIFEELDAPGEFYLNASTRMLYVVPTQDTESAFAQNIVDVIAPVHARVIQFRGSSPTDFAHDINLKGITVRHSAPTYMSDYEMPSGGDYSLHRGGAIFLDGTEDISIDSVHVDQAGGNGIFLSQHAWRTAITNNVVSHAGESAILLVGSTALMNGTRDTYPAYTQIQNNLCYEMGYYGKQTAAYFRSIAYRSNVTNNVFFNSPRHLVNYNDAFRGGDILAGNVMWGAVKETSDAASFNSWDRQSWFWEDAEGVTHFKPEIMQIQRNLILNKDFQYGSANSDWSIDHDDASSWYEDSQNVMVYGAHKWRDGVHKWYFGNLYVTPEDAGGNAQWGVGWYSLNTNSSKFYNNTMVNWAPKPQFHYVWSVPFPQADFQIHNNRYYTPGVPTLPFHVGGGGGLNPPGVPRPSEPASAIKTLQEWQEFTGDNDKDSTISANFDLEQTIELAEIYLQIPKI